MNNTNDNPNDYFEDGWKIISKVFYLHPGE
jgi:hypothetical protein